ncbi:MAG: toprim domain-containing protein [Burkholderiales bacterium]|nr:toprim domain-containing protein [Burkholderiales bacterium]
MNAAELSQRMASEAASIAQYLLPKGKRQSGEWKAGSTSGEEGKSLSVRLSGAKAGVWADFASGEGGDLLDLWMAVRGLSMSAAMSEAMQYLGIRDTMPEKPAQPFKRPAKPSGQAAKAGAMEWLQKRGLTPETIAAFKIAEQLRDGKTYALFPYLRDGELVNVKYRNVAEKRDMRQEGGAEPCLFGWHLIDPKARTVAICEGEIDAMTLHQVGVPALSVNAGAGNHQWIENDWSRLDRFSEILILFDNDESGEKGAREVMHRIGAERCKRVILPAKDANEYLLSGADGSDFWDCIKAAKPQDPEELRQASDFIDRVKAMFYPAHGDERDPVLRLDRDVEWFEFRTGELTVWTGYNGHGKSLMLSQILLGLMQQGERVVVFSGEMTPERQLKRVAKQASGLDRPTMGYLDAIGRWLHDKMWLFNVVGSASIERLLTVFLYASKRYGTRHFVIDSLMMTDVPEDGAGAMTAQKEAVRKLCDFAKRNNCHIHLVAHPRKGVDESKGPGKLDVAGSSKITDGADNVFTVWSARRDESKEVDPDEPDARLELQKQRNGDMQHYSLKLWFNKSAQQFCTYSRRQPVSYVDYSATSAVEAF